MQACQAMDAGLLSRRLVFTKQSAFCNINHSASYLRNQAGRSIRDNAEPDGSWEMCPPGQRPTRVSVSTRKGRIRASPCCVMCRKTPSQTYVSLSFIVSQVAPGPCCLLSCPSFNSRATPPPSVTRFVVHTTPTPALCVGMYSCTTRRRTGQSALTTAGRG